MKTSTLNQICCYAWQYSWIVPLSGFIGCGFTMMHLFVSTDCSDIANTTITNTTHLNATQDFCCNNMISLGPNKVCAPVQIFGWSMVFCALLTMVLFFSEHCCGTSGQKGGIVPPNENTSLLNTSRLLYKRQAPLEETGYLNANRLAHRRASFP